MLSPLGAQSKEDRLTSNFAADSIVPATTWRYPLLASLNPERYLLRSCSQG
jgi:hypothetical protein